MAEEAHAPETGSLTRKRKPGSNRAGKGKKKKQKQLLGPKKKAKRIDPKLKKFLMKKARDYDSGDEDEEGEKRRVDNREEGFDGRRKVGSFIGEGKDLKGVENREEGLGGRGKVGNVIGEREDLDEEEEEEEEELSGSEDEEGDGEEEGEDGGVEPEITWFAEGCRAFRIAFKSIMKISVADDDPLGPVLSARKKLVAEKLAEEESEKKVNKETKKVKHLVEEKGHVKPASYLVSHEKFLIGVATKGVVKLFNAVNKAQHAQKGLNPSRSKDAKVIKKRRKEAFYSELAKAPSTETVKGQTASGSGDNPSWAPLRDNYMLTTPKLKDWDKMADTAMEEDVGKMSEDSSSDDD